MDIKRHTYVWRTQKKCNNGSNINKIFIGKTQLSYIQWSGSCISKLTIKTLDRDAFSLPLRILWTCFVVDNLFLQSMHFNSKMFVWLFVYECIVLCVWAYVQIIEIYSLCLCTIVMSVFVFDLNCLIVAFCVLKHRLWCEDSCCV